MKLFFGKIIKNWQIVLCPWFFVYIFVYIFLLSWGWSGFLALHDFLCLHFRFYKKVLFTFPEQILKHSFFCQELFLLGIGHFVWQNFFFKKTNLWLYITHWSKFHKSTKFVTSSLSFEKMLTDIFLMFKKIVILFSV